MTVRLPRVGTLNIPQEGSVAMIGKAMLLFGLTAIGFGAGLAVAETTMQTGREPQFQNAEC